MKNTRDGTQLFIRAVAPLSGGIRGTVLVTHGMGEHQGRYSHVLQALTDARYRTIIWDLRGHGRSDGRRGDIRNYKTLIDDMKEVWQEVSVGPGPSFLYGHSLGGQLVLNFASAHKPSVAGLVITSPWLRLSFMPSRAKLLLAWAAAHLHPSFTQNTNIRPSLLSRDLDFLKSMPDLHLVHHRMSARMFQAVTFGAGSAFKQGAELPYPILLIHGGSDPVTDPSATETLFGQLPSRDKTLQILPDAFHETHNDLCRGQVIAQIISWLNLRTSITCDIRRLPSPERTSL